MNRKKSMYEILEVAPNASLEQIKVAHRTLSHKLMLCVQQQGMSREECESQLKILDLALHTLSNFSMRDAYDAELAAPNQELSVYEAKRPSFGNGTQTLVLAEETYRLSQSRESQLPVALSSVAKGTYRTLGYAIRAIFGLTIFAIVVVAARGCRGEAPVEKRTPEMAKAEEQLIILEYYKKYGERPASRAEAEFLEKEKRREINAQKAAEFAEKTKEEEYQRFVESSRRDGESIQNDMAAQEAYAERQRAREEQQERYQEEQAKREEELRIQREMNKYRAINNAYDANSRADGYYTYDEE